MILRRSKRRRTVALLLATTTCLTLAVRSVPARAGNVPLIRHALAGLAEALDMEPSEVADLKTVVSLLHDFRTMLRYDGSSRDRRREKLSKEPRIQAGLAKVYVRRQSAQTAPAQPSPSNPLAGP